MSEKPAKPALLTDTYLDNTGREDRLAGGVRKIPVRTERGTFHVWTKRIGNNPRIKLRALQVFYDPCTMANLHFRSDVTCAFPHLYLQY